jgi:hypothetical protein
VHAVAAASCELATIVSAALVAPEFADDTLKVVVPQPVVVGVARVANENDGSSKVMLSAAANATGAVKA